VLTLPFALRYRLAFDSSLVSAVLQIFVCAIFASIRRRAGNRNFKRKARNGAVSFVQRFGDDLNLNVHFHTLALDGIYMKDERGEVTFWPVGPPSDAEVARVTASVYRRVWRLLRRRGLGAEDNPDGYDELAHNQPLLSELYGASIAGRIGSGRGAGRRITRVGAEIDYADLADATPPGCACVSGFSVHAGVAIPAHGRMRLERLCRYTGRPPVATERLSLLPDGRLLYRLKRRWRDGTSHIIFDPLDLVGKLAALVPPPRFNLVRYHGVLAPSAAWRSLIVPEAADDDFPAHSDCPARKPVPCPEESRKKRGCRPRNYPWAELMRRVYSIDVLECPNCFGRMRILCAIHPPDAIRKILDCLGLPSRPPPIAGAFRGEPDFA